MPSVSTQNCAAFLPSITCFTYTCPFLTPAQQIFLRTAVRTTIHGIVEIIDSFHFSYPVGFYGAFIHCTLEVIIVVGVLSLNTLFATPAIQCCNATTGDFYFSHWSLLLGASFKHMKYSCCLSFVFQRYLQLTKGDILVNRLHLTNRCFQLHYLSSIGAPLAWHRANIMPNLFILPFSRKHVCHVRLCIMPTIV
jgi:hypothetical protein